MWRHLSDDRLWDVLEGAGDEPARGHLAACGECRTRLAEARAGLGLAGAAEVPEPSPLFWEAFRRQVGRRIADDRIASSPLWPALAAAATLVAALGVLPALQARRASTGGDTLPAWTALPPLGEDAGFSLLLGLDVGEDDVASVTEGRGWTAALATLTEAERRTLALALGAELAGGSS